MKTFKELREQSRKPLGATYPGGRITLDHGNLQLPGETQSPRASTRADVQRRGSPVTDPADFTMKDYTLGKRAKLQQADIAASQAIGFDQKVKEREAEIEQEAGALKNVRPYSAAYNDFLKSIATRKGMVQTTFTNPMTGERQTIKPPHYTDVFPEGSPERENFVEPTVRQRADAIQRFYGQSRDQIEKGTLVPDDVYAEMQRQNKPAGEDTLLNQYAAFRDTFRRQLDKAMGRD